MTFSRESGAKVVEEGQVQEGLEEGLSIMLAGVEPGLGESSSVLVSAQLIRAVQTTEDESVCLRG